MTQNAPRFRENVEIRYEKSAQNRAIHASGVWGGITPDGNILMGLFSEKSALPETRTLRVNPSGGLEDPPTPQGAVVREIEVEAFLSLSVAKALIPWLQDKVSQIERIAELRAGAAKAVEAQSPHSSPTKPRTRK